MHFAERLKIYCMPTSFSEFMACKVEALKIYVAAAVLRDVPSFSLIPAESEKRIQRKRRDRPVGPSQKVSGAAA